MDIDNCGVYIESTSLFSVDSHVVPSDSLLFLFEDRLDMWLEVTDVLSDEGIRDKYRSGQALRIRLWPKPTCPLANPCVQRSRGATPSCGTHGRMFRGASDVPKPTVAIESNAKSTEFERDVPSVLQVAPPFLFFPRQRRATKNGKLPTEVVVFEAHPAVSHQVGVPMSDGGEDLLEGAGRAHIRCERRPERVHRLFTSS